ncbi:FAD binding monooxygenase, putative [Penicillium digitatum PHI26]|uniref:FAD binding monooxygenase, putative n=2 Tax=Penicillium digitatum TaxID=36651 RepID=K9GD49_PEND2|nr:FAD binding monooxygenase, putative [Penicillium digitatum Pd1]EKV19034.1 FAD binding monooxygenase, putative [Penicillium digitatum PHI26]EKV21098.1 FAD binding monooxygenase, putative [Penicillium digitatum Pd1]
MYRQLGLTEDLLALGYKLPSTNLWINAEHKAHIPLGNFGRELSPYPFMLSVPQDDHERMLEKRLNDVGIRVERGTKLQGFVDHGLSITATLFRESDKSSTTHEASYIAGCDGAHSAVRQGISAIFEGETYKPLFYIADVEGKSDNHFNGEGNVVLTNDTFNLVVPYNKAGHVRLVGITMPHNDDDDKRESSEHENLITFDDVLPQIMHVMDIKITKVNWFSTYRSHHRVADKFRSNRAFLVGDAAHIHSPVGGQGMNTGIMDSINLAWKLATVLKQTNMTEEAKQQLLDSFESERRSFAMTIVKSTDAGFKTLTSKGFFPHILRNWLIPYLVPLLLKFDFARARIFRGASQLVCNYRGSTLCQSGKGSVQPGDRLPWVEINDVDNFSTLRDVSWQLHIYGDSVTEFEKWAREMKVKVFTFHWHDQYGKVGLVKNAVYLLRPDQYIAGIFEGSSVNGLVEYFTTRGFNLGCDYGGDF